VKKQLAWSKNAVPKRKHVIVEGKKPRIPDFEEAGRKLNVLMQITDPMLGLVDIYITQLQMMHRPREVSEEQKQQAVELAKKKGVRAANQFLKQCSASEAVTNRKTSRSFFFQYLMWLGLAKYAEDPKAHNDAVLRRNLRQHYEQVVKELQKNQAMTA